MKNLIAITLAIFLLSACQSDADKIAFSEDGTAFIQNDSLCIGGGNESSVLSYYYLEQIKSEANIPLLNSGDRPLKISYPDNCFGVVLELGGKYSILYIMNDIKYRYNFTVNTDGTITKIQRGS